MKRVYLLAFLLLFTVSLRAQLRYEADYYFHSPVYNNPAFSSYAKQIQATLVYARSGQGMESPHSLSLLQFHYPGASNSLHASMQTSRFAGFNMQSYSLNYAHTLTTGPESRLSLGMGTQALHYAVDWEALQPAQRNDPLLQNRDNFPWDISFIAGALWYTPQFFAGVSFWPYYNSGVRIPLSENEWTLQPAVSLQSGYTFLLSGAGATTHYVMPSLLLISEGNRLNLVQASVNYVYAPLRLGLVVNTNKEASFYAGFQLNRFIMDYGYRIGWGPVYQSTFGHHQFRLTYRIPHKKKHRCPAYSGGF